MLNRRVVFLLPSLLVFLSAGASLTLIAQTDHGACPNWSPKFDEIRDPDMVQVLRQQSSNWDGAIAAATAQGTDLSGQIAAGRAALQQLYDSLPQVDQTIRQLGGGNYQALNPLGCKRGQYTSALGAALCERLNRQNAIFAMEGTLDLLSCRAGSTRIGAARSSSPGSRASTDDTRVGIPAGAQVPSQPQSTAPPRLIDPSSFASAGTSSIDKTFDDLVKDSSADQQEASQTDRSSVSGQNTVASAGNSTSFQNASNAGTTSRDSPQGSFGGASNVGSPPNDRTWTDPLPAGTNSSNGGPASDDGSANPVSTQVEIANTLNSGVSNSAEVSATPVATVADSSKWKQFSSSNASPPSSTSSSSPSTGSDSNVLAPDATDQQIDRDMLIAGQEKQALGKILPTNEISDKITEQGIAVEGAAAHQMNHVLNDADSSGIFSTASPRNGGSVEQINSDLEGFSPAIGDALANAIPGYKYATTIHQDLTKIQNYAEKKANSISCLFSFDPYCK